MPASVPWLRPPPARPTRARLNVRNNEGDHLDVLQRKNQPHRPSGGWHAFAALSVSMLLRPMVAGWDNVYLFIANGAAGKRTWAYRYAGGPPLRRGDVNCDGVMDAFRRIRAKGSVPASSVPRSPDGDG